MKKNKMFYVALLFVYITFIGVNVHGQTIMHKSPLLIFTGEKTQMQINWQLDKTDTCIINWGLDTTYSLDSAFTHEYGSSHQHKYTVLNLQPATKYYYTVKAGGSNYSGSFVTPPTDEVTKLKFFFYGDTRSNPSDHNKVAQHIMNTVENDPEFRTFIINSGDLVSEGDQEAKWDSEFFNPSYKYIKKMLAELPYEAAVGNHERSGHLFAKYFPYPFISSRYYYSFDYGPAHFTVIDQYTNYTPGSVQYDWIVNDLSSTSKKWRFIILHRPGWSSGHHSNSSDVQNYIQPLCEQYHVSFVLAGHNHYYSRAVVNGVQHITSGGGGARLYIPESNFPNIVKVAMSHHYCTIEIDSNECTFTSIDYNGNVIERFTVSTSVTSVANEIESLLPSSIKLDLPYPNPFNNATNVSFYLPSPSGVNISIFNIQGQKIKAIDFGRMSKGYHHYFWEGLDSGGDPVASGTYIFMLNSDLGSRVQKMILLK